MIYLIYQWMVLDQDSWSCYCRDTVDVLLLRQQLVPLQLIDLYVHPQTPSYNSFILEIFLAFSQKIVGMEDD